MRTKVSLQTSPTCVFKRRGRQRIFSRSADRSFLFSFHSFIASYISLSHSFSLSPFPASPACLLPFVASETVFAWCALSPRLSRSSSFSRLHEDDRCRLASRDAARDVEKGVGGWGSLVTRGYRLAHYQLLQAYFQNLRPPGIK